LRKRSRFARLGVLSIALLLSLCVMGIGYAGWTDTVSIDGTMQMGYIEVVLSPDTEGSSHNISCSLSAPYNLHITLNYPKSGTYTYGFTIDNTGTIPVNIQSIDIDTSGVPGGVDVSVLGVNKSDQIEQAGVVGDSVGGTVSVIVAEDYGGTFSFDVTFSFVQWNLYEE
jgi:hypothetical protein